VELGELRKTPHFLDMECLWMMIRIQLATLSFGQVMKLTNAVRVHTHAVSKACYCGFGIETAWAGELAGEYGHRRGED